MMTSDLYWLWYTNAKPIQVEILANSYLLHDVITLWDFVSIMAQIFIKYIFNLFLINFYVKLTEEWFSIIAV